MLSHTSMRRHAPEYFSMVRRSACCASRDSLSTSFSTSTREDGGVSETSCIAMHRLLRTFVALATLHADEAPPRHVLDDLLHDVAVLGAARVGGVHLDMVVATHQRQVHLHLALPHLNLPLLLLHLDALHSRAEQLLQQRQHQGLLASARRAVEQDVRAVAVRHLSHRQKARCPPADTEPSEGRREVKPSLGTVCRTGFLPPRRATCATRARRAAHAHRDVRGEHTHAAAHTPRCRGSERARLPSPLPSWARARFRRLAPISWCTISLSSEFGRYLSTCRSGCPRRREGRVRGRASLLFGGRRVAYPERHRGRAGTRAARTRVSFCSQLGGSVRRDKTRG